MYKRGLEQFLFIFVLTHSLISITIAASPSRPCSFTPSRCSNIEQVVWATDGRSCFVFRNGCLLQNENRQRQYNNQPALRQVIREECQRLCRDICLAVFSPVCAEYNGLRRTFSNSCQLGAHICRTGQTYNLIAQGPCA